MRLNEPRYVDMISSCIEDGDFETAIWLYENAVETNSACINEIDKLVSRIDKNSLQIARSRIQKKVSQSLDLMDHADEISIEEWDLITVNISSIYAFIRYMSRLNIEHLIDNFSELMNRLREETYEFSRDAFLESINDTRNRLPMPLPKEITI